MAEFEGFSLEQKVDAILKTVVKTDSCLNQLKVDISNLRIENTELKETISSMEEKIRTIEMNAAKNNLVFYGLSGEANNRVPPEDIIMRFVKEKLGVILSTNDITGTFFLGNSNNIKRPILVKLINFNTKQSILRNAFKLKGSAFSISEYFPTHIQEKRRKLIPYFHQAKEAGRSAFLKFDILYIDNIKYTLTQCENGELPPNGIPRGLERDDNTGILTAISVPENTGVKRSPLQASQGERGAIPKTYVAQGNNFQRSTRSRK